MKKYAVLFVVALVVGAFLAGPALAEVTLNVKEPLDMSLFVPCANDGAGEVVQFTGFLHVKITLTDNGKNQLFTSSYQPMGVSGVGEDTGDIYRGTGGTRTTSMGYVTGYPARYTYVNNFRFIGPGKGNNFTLHETIHLTINANNEVTAEVDNYRVDCK